MLEEKSEFEKMKEQMAKRRKELADLQNQSTENDLPKDFIDRCVADGEKGLGRLYCAVNDGDVKFETVDKEFYVWKRHHYQKDIDRNAQISIEGVSEVLTERLYQLIGQKRRLKNEAEKEKE